MKVGVIGAGFTGLAAAMELVDSGVEVVVWEKENSVGGLASGFKEKGWRWSLDHYYHHVFAGDREVLGVSKKVGGCVIWGRPKSNSWIDGKEWRLDTPMSVVGFKPMSLWGRLRMGVGLAVLKMMIRGEWLERYRVVDVLPWLIGKEGYKKIWERMLRAKFGKYVDQVSLSWFWARVIKRTQKLGYFDGGFEGLTEKMVRYVEDRGGEVRLRMEVKKVKKVNDGWIINGEMVDVVLVTTPAPMTKKLFKGINIPRIDYLWGQTLILGMDRGLIGGYWLNILEKEWPFLVLVEQTNWMDKKHYGDRVIIYLGNYLEEGDERLKMNKEKLLKLYWPYLKKINPEIKRDWVLKSWKFQSPFAQPVFPVNYSQEKPDLFSGVKGVYMANMSMVYPWDRGVNYAVKIGQRAARKVLSDYNMGNE